MTTNDSNGQVGMTIENTMGSALLLGSLATYCFAHNIILSHCAFSYRFVAIKRSPRQE